jgi:hypothetical protein
VLFRSSSNLRSIGASFAAFAVLVAPDVASAVGLMINEFRVGTGSPDSFKMADDEFVEFVLTTNATASELASLTFGDSNHQTSRLNSILRFDQATLDLVLANAGKTSFLAGTFIVVKGAGLGAQNLTYNPLATNTANADAWSIELVAGQGARDHPETTVDGVFDLDRKGGVVWVSTDNPPVDRIDTSSFISAIGFDDKPGAVADAVVSKFGAGSILGESFTGARVVQNVGGSNVSLVANTSATLGAPNNAMNASWIEGNLRFVAAPEPSRAFLILCALSAGIMRRRRAKG